MKAAMRSTHLASATEEALREVIFPAYPSATITWLSASATPTRVANIAGIHTGGSSTAATKRDRRVRPPQEEEQLTELLTRDGGSGSPTAFTALAVRPLSSSAECPLTSRPLWAALQRHYGPQLTTVPGAYPRCRFHTDGAPLWTPHAIVAIGGFDGGDLRERVMPAVVAQVPTLSEGLRSLISHSASSSSNAVKSSRSRRHVETVQGRRRPPAYMQRKRFAADSFSTKGCCAYGSCLLELCLPDTRGGGAHDCDFRQRVFVTVGCMSTTLTDLQREPQASRRTLLRGAFGSALPLLQQALPRPLAVAAAAVRHRADRLGMPEVSSAFWVSALAHGIGIKGDAWLDEKEIHVAGVDDAHKKAILARIRRRLSQTVSDLQRRINDTVPALDLAERAEETHLLAHILSCRVIEWVARCSQAEWEDVLLCNFFLPAERFDACHDVQALSRGRHGWRWSCDVDLTALNGEMTPLLDNITRSVSF